MNGPAARARWRARLLVAGGWFISPLAWTMTARAEPQWDPGRHATSDVSGEVRADDAASSPEGVYGRFEAPFDLGIHAGAEIDHDGAAAAARASLHYFSTAGIYAGYGDAVGGDALGGSRVVSFGVDARPAFIPRWSKNLEQGDGFFDLAIDSISFGVGGYFGAPRGGTVGDERGFELSLGFGLPLAMRAFGPWLGARGLLRWEDAGGSDAAAKASVLVTLGWHFPIGG